MLNKVIKSVLSLIDGISEYTGKFFGILIVVLILLMVAEVTLRYGFNRPIMGIQDIDAAYFGAYYTMAGAYTLLVGGHVRVDIVHALFPPRGRAILDLVTFPFFLLFAGAMLWASWQFAMNATWIGGIGWNLEVDQSHLRLPLYPMKWTLFIGTALLLLQGLAKLVRDLKFSATGRELA